MREFIMNNKTASIAISVLGALILLASLTADVTGLGDDPGFGGQQTIGTVFGVVVLAVGVYLYKKIGPGSTSAE